MIDIQDKLDEWLAGNTEAQKYVDKVYYLPELEAVPDDVTHIIRLASVQSAERQFRIGFVCKQQFAVFLDAILALIATQGGKLDEGNLPTPPTKMKTTQATPLGKKSNRI